MKKSILLWIEEYLFNPNFFQKILSFLLLPLTSLYCLIVLSKRYFSKKEDFHLPIISIGNLIIGGSGKTPFTIALAKEKRDVAIILRGYGRKSKGLFVIKDKNRILIDDIKISGDEAMLLATSLPNSIVIVSEDRKKAILRAKSLGAKSIILDDGFSKVDIKKFDILLKAKEEPTNPFCLPSGGYREPKFLYKKANLVVEEERDFKRVVEIENRTERMILITAISKPKRLNPFLPKNLIAKYYFPDHYFFTEEELKELIKKSRAISILTTEKDAVKMRNFDLNLSILKLTIEIKEDILERIKSIT